MKKKKIDPQRRAFFATAGAGLLAGGLTGLVPKAIAQTVARKRPTARGSVSVSIHPHAVKRMNKG